MNAMHDRVLELLEPYVTPLVARAVVDCLERDRGVDLAALDGGTLPDVVRMIDDGVKPFLPDAGDRERLHDTLERELPSSAGRASASVTAAVIEAMQSGDARVVVNLENEFDIVTARGRGKEICEQVGFPKTSQVKVATVVSELARNIIQYAGNGRIELTPLDSGRPGIEVVASDKGPGIPHIETVLSGGYQSKTGMGMGLYGTRNLMDEFDVQTAPGMGTTVRARKYL